jgi:2-polyprenyl-3-methyl-5-hydroxy-6-metoxy-1,4-benzoquinol methylase
VCCAAEVLFDLAFEFICRGGSRLDVCIGTGLTPEPFAKASLNISGIDASNEALAICRAKRLPPTCGGLIWA